MNQEYLLYLNRIWGLARQIFKKEDIETEVHNIIDRLFNVRSIKELSSAQCKMLIKYLKMLDLENHTDIEFNKLSNSEYCELWIAQKCKQLRKNGVLKPLLYLDALYSQFYNDELFKNTLCWHIAFRIKRILNDMEQYKNPYNDTHKNILRRKLERLNLIGETY